MSKTKVHIIGSDYQTEEAALEEASRMRGWEVVFHSLGQLHFRLTHQVEWFLEGTPFPSFSPGSVAIIRRSRGHYEKLLSFLDFLSAQNIPHTDSYDSTFSNLNKFLFLPQITSSLFPHPNPTYIVSCAQELNALDISFPCVSKPVMGRHGEGILFHDDRKTLEHTFDLTDEPQIVQPALDIDYEFRIFVVGDQSLGAVKKNPAEGEKVANYAHGASFESIDLAPEIHQEAIRLCQAQKIDIGGVDIAKTKEGDLFFLEVNRCPEFKAFASATGINVAEKILDFVATLVR